MIKFDIDVKVDVHIHPAGESEILSSLRETLNVLNQLKGNINTIMATQAEFQAKIDQINANTTASAAAAQSIKAALDDLRAKVANMGLSADQEAAIFAALDGPANTSAALKTFLEQTAAGPTEPPPVTPVTPVTV